MRAWTLLAGLISLGLCIGCDPVEAFGPGLVLGACGTSQGQFPTLSACKLFTYWKATELVNNQETGYTLLLPRDDIMSSYLTKRGLTLDEFTKNPESLQFVKNHVFAGSITASPTVTNLAGKTYDVTTVNGQLQVSATGLRLEYDSGNIKFYTASNTIGSN